jgi:hypothetical protein
MTMQNALGNEKINNSIRLDRAKKRGDAMRAHERHHTCLDLGFCVEWVCVDGWRDGLIIWVAKLM